MSPGESDEKGNGGAGAGGGPGGGSGGGGPGGGGDPKFRLIYIINGEDIESAANPNQPLRVSRDKALTASGNTGRPFDDWEIRTEAGVLLPPDGKVESYGLRDGARLLLTLRVAAGG